MTGPLLPYLLRWMAMLSVGIAAAARRRPWRPLLRARAEASRRPLVFLTAGLIALALVTGRNLALAQSLLKSPPAPTEASEAAARLAEAIDAGVSTTQPSRRWSRSAPHTDRDLVLGVVLAMDKAGTRFAVRPFGPFRLGGRWTPDGRRTRAWCSAPKARSWRRGRACACSAATRGSSRTSCRGPPWPAAVGCPV